MLLYIHGDCTDYYGRGAKDVHLYFTQFLSSDSRFSKSTEAKWLIRDGDRVEGRKRMKARPRAPTRRPRRPWTAARTTKMLRQCPLAIAQQLVYYAIAVSAAVRKLVLTMTTAI